MANRLDAVIVVDVEATCWAGKPPAGEQPEIIEIGVCMVDVALWQPINVVDILVRPALSRVSPFCSQLTTLTQQQVESGVPFDEACTTLRHSYHVKERLWASYGDYDRRQFERQCRVTGIPYPFGPSHLNIKSLVALTYGLTREIGMDEAMAMMGLRLEGTHHRARDDAWNIAHILIALLRLLRDK